MTVRGRGWRFKTQREMKKEGSLEASGPLKSGDGGDEKVPFFKLFSFADALDFVLMIVGTVAAIFSGFSMPLMTLLFGQLINKFGDTHKSDIVHVIAKVLDSPHHLSYISI